ncbi:phosphate acetyltransferase [Marinovum algicola]|uniref:phosphate acetyltransferase n=1 Tax=Marinovum algicola TaxID=42444 RepID=UPI0032EF511F
MKVGDRAELRRSYTAADLADFAALAGAAPAAHVPEPLIAALFSHLLGVDLPGAGTNYLKQELHFTGRAAPQTELTATVEITRLRPEKHLVDLWARCTDAGGQVICEGRALVKTRDVTPAARG